MAQRITVCNKNFGYSLGTGYPGIETGTRVRVLNRVPGYPFRTLIFMTAICHLESLVQCAAVRIQRLLISEPPQMTVLPFA